MKAVLDALLKKTETIDQYRAFLLEVEASVKNELSSMALTSTHPIVNLWASMSHQKIYAYTAIVISLYGALERFVEDLAESYVYLVCRRTPVFDALPDEIIKQHIPKSITLLEKVQQPNYRGSLNITTIVGNLHRTLTENISNALNAKAYSVHTANMRCSIVDQMFNSVGVKNITDRAKHWKSHKEDIKSTSSSHWPLIDDLADRRNEVSHGMPPELLSLDILKDYIVETNNFCRCIYDIAVGESLRPLVNHIAIELPEPIDVIDHRIVCISNGGQPISVGDSIIVKTNDPIMPFKIGKIERIEINNESTEKVEAGSELFVGLQVDMHIKTNHKYYILTK